MNNYTVKCPEQKEQCTVFYKLENMCIEHVGENCRWPCSMVDCHNEILHNVECRMATCKSISPDDANYTALWILLFFISIFLLGIIYYECFRRTRRTRTRLGEFSPIIRYTNNEIGMDVFRFFDDEFQDEQETEL